MHTNHHGILLPPLLACQLLLLALYTMADDSHFYARSAQLLMLDAASVAGFSICTQLQRVIATAGDLHIHNMKKARNGISASSKLQQHGDPPSWSAMGIKGLL